MAATDDFLGQVHKLLAEHYKSQLENPEDLTPQMLKEIREFLKDNKIESADSPAAPVRQLADQLGDVDVLPFPASN